MGSLMKMCTFSTPTSWCLNSSVQESHISYRFENRALQIYNVTTFFFSSPQPNNSSYFFLHRSTPMRDIAFAVLSPESTTRSCYCTSSNSTSDQGLLQSHPPPLPSAGMTEYWSLNPSYAFSHSFWKGVSLQQPETDLFPNFV